MRVRSWTVPVAHRRGRVLGSAMRRADDLEASSPAHDAEAGSAVVEFLGVTLVLLVPIVYLVLVLAQLQAGAFAVDGAAREAGRVFVTSNPDEAHGRAAAAAGLAFEDQGFTPKDAAAALSITCSEADCHEPGSTVTVAVELDVVLLGVPDVVADAVPLSIPVHSVVTVPVDRFAGGP